MRIVDRLTILCLEKKYLDETDADVFHYELERRLATAIVALPFFILASLLSSFVAAVSLFWSFYIIRERSSGYHSKTLARCICFSLVLEFGFLKLLYTRLTPQISIFVFAISLVVILFLAPFNHPNMQLSLDEYKACRKSLWFNITVIALVMMLSLIFQLHDVIYGLTTGIAMAAFLLCLAYIFQNRSVNND